MGIFNDVELEFFKREVDRFVTDAYGAERRQEIVDSGQFGTTEWRTLGDLGWLGIGIPESYGGVGGTLSDQLTILRAAGRGLLVEPFIATLVVGMGLIDQLGREAQKADLARRVASGELTLGFAHTPSGIGNGGSGMVSRRHPAGGGFTLAGTKRSVLHGKAVDLLLVTARDAIDGSLRCFLVTPHALDAEWHTYRMIDDQVAGDVTFHDVTIPADSALDAGSVDRALRRTLAAAAISVAAESVGAMDALLDMTLEYMKVRRQFGRALGSFQVLQHRMVDMTIATRKTDALVKMAASAYDAASDDCLRIASACKAVAAKAGRFVGEQAIQMHGGIGMTEEYQAGHYLKRLLLLGAHFGDADFHLQALAGINHRMESATCGQLE